MAHQIVVFAVLGLALILFVWGRWRYDLVALFALLAIAFAGILDSGEVFAGFGHPAVITVAAVLVVSRGLSNAGVVDSIAAALSWVGDRHLVQLAVLVGLVAVLSGFINNVGALALFMPLAIRMARQSGRSPSALLMPIAFASLLGGLTTLIGTPPNIIIATFRAEDDAAPFLMFDFLPVGGLLMLLGIAFIVSFGWRLIPQREGEASDAELFEIEDYITELRVPEDGRAEGKTYGELVQEADGDVVVLGIVRGERSISALRATGPLRAGDILIVEADSDALEAFVEATRLELAGSHEESKAFLGSEAVTLQEAVVLPDSLMVDRSTEALNLRVRYGVNLLAAARRGRRLTGRLKHIRFQPGDVLLLQGTSDTLGVALKRLGCLPLGTERREIGAPRRLFTACSLFVAGVAAAALGLLPVEVAFTAVAAGMIVTGLLSLKEAYESISWPVIVLLGAMIPVGDALERTGGADLVADALLRFGAEFPAAATLGMILVSAMLLSNVINNAAAAVLMAPVALAVAEGLSAAADPFLMAVAVGSSAAFLTPIGHQSNTLVMGPGGYHFADYWRMGLPLSILVAAASVPLILYFWPLY